jgi:uncharacterized protein
MDDVDGGQQKIDAIVAAWLAGDVTAIGRMIDEEIANREPAAYRALIVDRNVAWAKEIADRLKGSGVTFIAVGAGHLTGADSVQVQLAKYGIKVEHE